MKEDNNLIKLYNGFYYLFNPSKDIFTKLNNSLTEEIELLLEINNNSLIRLSYILIDNDINL